ASFSCFGVKVKKAIPPFSLSFKIISTYFHIFASASTVLMNEKKISFSIPFLGLNCIKSITSK
ncbi:MAG: hypothetical protein PVG39_24340, partial [Desulfobacteraceae bacterium]